MLIPPEQISLYLFPCGCICDPNEVEQAGPAVQCYWCGATFFDEDLKIWFEESTEKFWIENPKSVIRYGDEILQAEARWSCAERGPIWLVSAHGFQVAIQPHLVELLRD